MIRGCTIFYLIIWISISSPLSSLWPLIRNCLTMRERDNERMRMSVYSFLLPLLGLSLFSTVNMDVLYHQRKHIKMLFLKVITEIQSLLPANLQDNDSKHCPRWRTAGVTMGSLLTFALYAASRTFQALGFWVCSEYPGLALLVPVAPPPLCPPQRQTCNSFVLNNPSPNSCHLLLAISTTEISPNPTSI